MGGGFVVFAELRITPTRGRMGKVGFERGSNRRTLTQNCHELVNYHLDSLGMSWKFSLCYSHSWIVPFSRDFSSMQGVSFGVPFESVLEPLLFTLFINDTDAFMFADDMVINVLSIINFSSLDNFLNIS